MSTARLSIEVLSFWHIGTGKGGGPTVDALVAKTTGGLPYLPGKALKGLLRDMLQSRLSFTSGRSFTQQDIDVWFGTSLPSSGKNDDAKATLEEFRFLSEQGVVCISSAKIGENEREQSQWEEWALSKSGIDSKHLFFQEFSSTKLDSDGSTIDGSLRSIELTVPMNLHAMIEGPAKALDAISEALPLLRSIGANRTRGLGRVNCNLEVLR